MAEIDSTGRPAYVYNASDNKWYEVAGKVDPTANFNWTGTHSFSNPVTVNNTLVVSKRFNVFTNQTSRAAAMSSLGPSDRGHISFLQNEDAGPAANRLEYWNGSSWATLIDPATTVTLNATQTLTNKTLGSSISFSNATGTAPFSVSSTTKVANLNVDFIDGLDVHTGRNNEANKIVRTDSSGYLQTGYINSSSGDENNNSNPNRVWGTNGSDSYLRTYRTSALSVGYASSSGYATTAGYANDTPYSHGTFVVTGLYYTFGPGGFNTVIMSSGGQYGWNAYDEGTGSFFTIAGNGGACGDTRRINAIWW